MDVEIDPQRPSGARVYDYYLGGSHHFAADRQAAEVALAAMPELRAVLRSGRAFLQRAVTVAASAGLDQFLDLGAGIPAPGWTVPAAVRALRPAARVVSVDIDPVAVVHTRRAAGDDPCSAVLQADLTDAGEVLGSEPVRGVLDLTRPVCLLAVAVAHFIPDTERLGRALEHYREAVAPGSYLALSHACGEDDLPYARQVLRLYNHTTSPMTLREREELRAFFGDWTLLEPGVVSVAEWRPAPGEEAPGEVVRRSLIAGVAVKSPRNPHMT